MNLDLRNVSKFFGQKAAVETVSLTLEGPGFVGVIGRSGAGKSTLLRMLNRLGDATTRSEERRVGEVGCPQWSCVPQNENEWNVCDHQQRS